MAKAISLVNPGDLANPGIASQYIDATLTAYSKVGRHLHAAACVALFHAWKHGQPDLLTRFYRGLRVNDQTAFRTWVGEYSAVTVKQDDGSEVIYNWAGFKEEDKGTFIVKKSSANARAMVDFVGIPEMQETVKNFWDIKINPERKPLTLEALLKLIAGFKAKAEKKADEDDIAIPRDLEVELTRLTDVANRFLAVASTQGTA